MSTTQWTWPNATRAAISLTYDDGNLNNLELAIPQLDAAGLPGTFYLPTGYAVVRDHASAWRAAFERGHEMGNHTVHHPCRVDAYESRPDWLKAALDEYTAEQLTNEIAEADRWLNEHIGYDSARSYAHPCCHTAVGTPPDEAGYDKAIRRFYQAARIGGDAVNNPAEVNLLRIQSFVAMQPGLDTLKQWCEDAAEQGGWAVLMFHGIGDDHRFSTQADVHEQFVNWLAEQHLWVQTCGNVARFVSQMRGDRPRA